MCQYSVFYGEYEKKAWQKKFDLPQREFEPRIFEQAPADNLNFEGYWINRAHGSWKISTLEETPSDKSKDEWWQKLTLLKKKWPTVHKSFFY